MNIRWLTRLVAPWLIDRSEHRIPDLTIHGEMDAPIMHRWWQVPRNRLLNVYLHNIVGQDEQRALHDHPWWSLTVVLKGSYVDQTIAPGGIHKFEELCEGAIKFRFARQAHRLEAKKQPCWTLFITGPKIREWGFHCAKAGWVHWKAFCNPRDEGLVGSGCEQ